MTNEESESRLDRKAARAEAKEIRDDERSEREAVRAESRANHGEEDSGVSISNNDLSEIISGIKSLPPAIGQMADSIKTLADNMNQAPTRRYTTWLVAGSSVLILIVLVLSALDRRNFQSDLDRQTTSTKELVTEVANCLAVEPVNGINAQGPCAERLFAIFEEGMLDLRQDTRCEIQVSLIEFIELNQIEVTPPTLNSECVPYSEGRADDGN